MNEVKTKATKAPRRKATTAKRQIVVASSWHRTELVTRLAMLGVSLGSLAQMMGYPDLSHALLTVGGLCGAGTHIGGTTR